jgi:phosphoglycerate dehydrogenase-like enzyme
MSNFRVGYTRDFGPDGIIEGVLDKARDEYLVGVPGLEAVSFEEYHDPVLADQPVGFDFVITGEPHWTAESFSKVGDRLTGLAYWGVGTDDLDIEAATANDVAICITVPAVRRSMAESIVLFMLALSKNLMIKDRLTREGRAEERTAWNGINLEARTIGAVGLGNIGMDLVELLRPFRPGRIVAYDPYLDEAVARERGIALASLEETLAAADFVTVMCPLNESTRGMLGAEQFALMKPSAYFINAARGGIVQQAALTEALAEGRIKGAALDVFEVEPPPPDDPLLALDSVIATPHCIGWTEELYYNNSVEDCRAALSVFRGEVPEYVVNKEVLDRPGFKSKLARHSERKAA